jgi:hypothetical protein
VSAPLEVHEIANPELVGALLDGDPTGVSAALEDATLLAPASVTGSEQALIWSRAAAGGRRLVCGFTDLEALRAWDRQPATAAVALEARVLRELIPGATLALNPAGPGAHLLGGEAWRGERDAGDHDRDRAALIDPAGRRELRARACHAHEQARRTAATGQHSDACDELRIAIDACAVLGDRLHGAAAELELARWRARTGSTTPALASWRRSAETLALLGESDLAVDALLTAAETAVAAARSAEAESLSVTALDVIAGADVSDRLVAIWSGLDGH